MIAKPFHWRASNGPLCKGVLDDPVLNAFLLEGTTQAHAREGRDSSLGKIIEQSSQPGYIVGRQPTELPRCEAVGVRGLLARECGGLMRRSPSLGEAMLAAPEVPPIRSGLVRTGP